MSTTNNPQRTEETLRDGRYAGSVAGRITPLLQNVSTFRLFPDPTYPDGVTGVVTGVDTIVRNNYNTTFGESVLGALDAPEKRLNMFVLPLPLVDISFKDIEINIGYTGGAVWDPAVDLLFYVGDSLLATVPGANLVNNTGVANAARKIKAHVKTVIELANGTFDSVGGMQFTNVYNTLNVRLSAPFPGTGIVINIQWPVIFENKKNCGDCNTTVCNYPTSPDTKYCSAMAGDTCAVCPTLGNDATNVSTN